MATIEEVKQVFEQKQQIIFSLDQGLAAERAALKRRAFREGRPMSYEEVARRKEISSTRLELAEALRVLALEKVEELENADDVDALLAEIEAINQQLADDLAHLNQLAEYADKAAKVTAGFAKLAEKLADFRPSLV